MNKEQKYKEIAKMLFERLVMIEREIKTNAKSIEEGFEGTGINFYIEIGDFIPVTQLLEIIGITNGKEESIILDDIYYIIDKSQKVETGITNFLEKYI